MAVNPGAETLPSEGAQNAALAAGESRAAQIQSFASELNTEFGGTSLGAAYIKYLAAHPTADPSATYTTVETRVYAFVQLGGSLGNAISQMFGAEGTALNQIAVGSTGGLEQVSKDANSILPSWSLDVSGLKDWFFRGLMVGGGLFLMVLGISKLTGVSNQITQAAEKIPVIPV